MVSDNVAVAIKKAKSNGAMQQVFGWIITIFCGMISSVGAGSTDLNEPVNLIMVIIFAILTVLGVSLIVKGHQRKKLINKYYDYQARLMADPDKSIDLLSSSTGATVLEVTKNISDMIALGFFPGAYLDTTHNRLIMKADRPTASHIFSSTLTITPTQTEKYVTVQCKGCGATNKITSGAVGECEFCGSQISDS